MVFVELNGRLGNYLFQIAAAASLANQNHDDFTAVCHTRYLLPDGKSVAQYVNQFKSSIFKKVNIIEYKPVEYQLFEQAGHAYSPIKYQPEIYLFGTYQSERYFEPDVVRQLFEIPSEIKEILDAKYGNILNKGVTALHVRRGDYLKFPHEYNVASRRFFRKAIERIGSDTDFLLISDDINWCKKHFKGDNFYFAEGNTAIEDMYLQSLCKNNIISNSTFSWWGAWLNTNSEKIVIAPDPWYGRAFSNIETHDLLPSSWIKIPNKLETDLWWKANKIILTKKFTKVKTSIKQGLKQYLFNR